MLKKLLMAGALVLVAAVCLGYEPKYEVTYEEVKVGHGGTMWEIADYYYKFNEFSKMKKMCFAEYLHNVRHDPKNEALTANGRTLQPSDIVKVPIFKVVDK